MNEVKSTVLLLCRTVVLALNDMMANSAFFFFMVAIIYSKVLKSTNKRSTVLNKMESCKTNWQVISKVHTVH